MGSYIHIREQTISNESAQIKNQQYPAQCSALVKSINLSENLLKIITSIFHCFYYILLTFWLKLHVGTWSLDFSLDRIPRVHCRVKNFIIRKCVYLIFLLTIAHFFSVRYDITSSKKDNGMCKRNVTRERDESLRAVM